MVRLSRIKSAAPALPFSPRGRGCEAMTYGCVTRPRCEHALADAAVSHLAELVRGDFHVDEGPLIRPFGPPSPQGEKGTSQPSQDGGATAHALGGTPWPR